MRSRPSALFLTLAFGLVSCNLGPQQSPAAAEPPPPPPAPAPEPEPEPVPEPDPLSRAGPLHYLEIVTGGAGTDDTLPMIIAIHGLGDTPHNFAEFVADFDAPARIILPRGVDPTDGDGWSWYPLRATDPDVEGLARGIVASTEVVAQGVDVLVRERPTRGRPIVTGFSQGGMLSFALATHHPGSFSAALPVGGWLPPPLWPEDVADPSAYPPLVALHGDADQAVAIEPTRESVTALKKLGLRAELHEYPEVGHMITPPMREELFSLLRQSIADQSIANDDEEKDDQKNSDPK